MIITRKVLDLTSASESLSAMCFDVRSFFRDYPDEEALNG
jgi:hypothetical protein